MSEYRPRSRTGTPFFQRLLIIWAPLLLIMVFPSIPKAQTLDTLELNNSETEMERDWDFGFTGIIDTNTGLNKDRPRVSTLLWAAPQLKYKEIYRLQINMGFIGYYLNSAPNPWDLTDWSLQLSDLSIFKHEATGLNFAGDIRYYFPTSISSRNADSRGALRGTFKLNYPLWKFRFGLMGTGFYRFAKYNTSDPQRWQDPDKMISNGRITFGEGLFITFIPIDKIVTSLSWTFNQHQDYYPDKPYDGVGSSFIVDNPRKNDVWEHSWAINAEVSVNVWKWFFVNGGYGCSAPVLQGDSAGVHYNPFDAKYAQLYLDLMVVY